MQPQWVFIEPSDVLFFRDALPYAPGSSGTSRYIFPPSPQTLAGAFRSYLLAASGAGWDYTKNGSQAGQKILETIGDTTTAGTFQMRGPFLGIRKSTYIMPLVALPADAYQKTGNRSLYNSYRPLESTQLEANWELGYRGFFPLWPPAGTRQDEPPETAWLDSKNLKRYLDGKDFSIRRDLFAEEMRTTIALEYSQKRAKEEMLSTAPFLRMHSSQSDRIGLLAQVNAEELGLPQKGCLSLGGEARAATFEIVPNSEVYGGNFTTCDVQTTHLKLLLLTPAWLKSGWEKMSTAEWSLMLGASVKVKRLVTAALGRPLFVSGWDLNKNQAKETLALFPPGSVFYFELESAVSPVDVSDLAFTQSPVNDLYASLGFGRVAAASWEWQV